MINSLMNDLSQFLGIDIILADQDAPQPTFPYGTYKNTSVDIGKPHTRIRKQNDAGSDNVGVTYFYDRSVVVQLNFYNRGDSGDLQDEIMQHAQKAWMWINEQGREICRLSDAVPLIVSDKIASEVKVVENRNEYHVSFDFAVKSKVENISTVEAITGVDYTFEIKI